VALSGRNQVKLRTGPTIPADDQEDPEDAGAEGHDPGNHGNGGAPPHTLRTGTGVLVVVFMPGAPPFTTRLGPVRF
jgi:hypothetical protein